MNVALTSVKDTIASISSGVVDDELRKEIARLANQRKVLPTFEEDLTYAVRSPLLSILENSYNADTTGMSHVLYAEPSAGKTSACRIYVEKLMAQYDAPSLMISGQAPNQDYFAHVADQLGVKREGSAWMASLLAALRPEVGSDRPHATLILDEFNYRGPQDMNLQIAEALCKQIYNNSCGFSLLLVTQNRELADYLCKMNKWQKIGPLPGLTTPDRWSVDEEEGPPCEIVWRNVDWSTARLTVLILKRFPGKFDAEVQEGILPWLTRIKRPTRAIEIATARLFARLGERKTVNLP